MRKIRLTLVAVIATCAFAASAGSASAACVAGVCTDTQQVLGTPLSTLALGVPAPPIVSFLTFGPGQTSSASGTVLVTSTNAWTLSAHDAVNAGHMARSAVSPLCPAGSTAQTANQLSVTSTGTGALGTASAGAKTIAGTATQIANGTVTDTVTNAFGITVGAAEPMATGCTYATTVTYTLQ
jgi:hypothetical protein